MSLAGKCTPTCWAWHLAVLLSDGGLHWREAVTCSGASATHGPVWVHTESSATSAGPVLPAFCSHKWAALGVSPDLARYVLALNGIASRLPLPLAPAVMQQRRL